MIIETGLFFSKFLIVLISLARYSSRPISGVISCDLDHDCIRYGKFLKIGEK